MSRAYSFQKNNKPNPPKKPITEKYTMTFTYYDNFQTYVNGSNGEKSHTLSIDCGNIPDACGMFHEATKKRLPHYFISDISIRPIMQEEKEVVESPFELDDKEKQA